MANLHHLREVCLRDQPEFTSALSWSLPAVPEEAKRVDGSLVDGKSEESSLTIVICLVPSWLPAWLSDSRSIASRRYAFQEWRFKEQI
mmetsp:Transcript_54445/g.176985  ORF Transcript_54445/g.176985 Transcript_54445/m.176985 type:complete len:88 (+) Transcript_54445:285-548(+)